MATVSYKEYAKRKVRLKFIPNQKGNRYANSKAKLKWVFFGQIQEVPILIASQILEDHPERFVVAKPGEKSAQVGAPSNDPSLQNPFPVPPALTEEDMLDASELMELLGGGKEGAPKISDIPDNTMQKFDLMSAEQELIRDEVEADNKLDPMIENSPPQKLELSEAQGAVLEVVGDSQPLKISAIAKGLGSDNWREVEPHVKALLGHKLITKNDDNEYSLAS